MKLSFYVLIESGFGLDHRLDWTTSNVLLKMTSIRFYNMLIVKARSSRFKTTQAKFIIVLFVWVLVSFYQLSAMVTKSFLLALLLLSLQFLSLLGDCITKIEEYEDPPESVAYSEIANNSDEPFPILGTSIQTPNVCPQGHVKDQRGICRRNIS